MKLAILTAVLFIAHGAVSWRYYPHGNQQWHSPQGQPFRHQHQDNGYMRSANPPYGSNPWLQSDIHSDYVQNAMRGAQWICRNPHTGDMVIIGPDDENSGNPGNGPLHPQSPQQPHSPWYQPQQPQEPGQSPWQQPSTSYPGNTQPHQSNNPWNNPFLNGNRENSAIEGTTPPTTTSTITEPPVTHGGVGQIDVRIGK